MTRQCRDCKEEVQPDARFCPHCGVRLKRELKSHVRPPSRPPTSRKHAPVVVTEEVPEARPTSETNDERQRLLRRYEKREQLKKEESWWWPETTSGKLKQGALGGLLALIGITIKTIWMLLTEGQ